MMQTKESADNIYRHNLLALLSRETSGSMCRLSRRIHTCDNYVHKILTGKIHPSLDNIHSVSTCFHLENWEMIYSFEKGKINSILLIDLQLMNNIPSYMLPLIWDYIAFILR